MSITDRALEREICIAASRPLRFFDIADEFYRLSRFDPHDKELWSRFFHACKRLLVEAPSDGPYTLLVARQTPAHDATEGRR